MNQIRKFAIGMSMLSADIVLLSCCLYFTVIIEKTEWVTPNLFLWFGVTAIAYVINLILQNKQVRVSTLFLCNLIWMILSAILVCLLFTSDPAGLFLKVFVCGVIIVIEGHSCYLALTPFKTEQCVLFLDALIVVIALFLCGCELRQLSGVLPMQILCFAVVGYMLIALIFLRTSPTGQTQATVPGNILSGASISGRIGVFIALGSIVTASCILCALLSLKAGQAAQNLWSLFIMLLKNMKDGLHVIGEKCTAFFSRFDTQTDSAGVSPIQSPSSSSGAGNAWIPVPDIPLWIPLTIGIAVLILAAVLIVRALLHLKKEKLSSVSEKNWSVTVTRRAVSRPKASRWRKLLDKLILRYRMHCQKKTPVGLAILARKMGNSIGVSMQKKETWHSYVTRLSAFGDTPTLLELARFLERYFYSGNEISLSQEQYTRFARSLKQLQRTALK